MKTTRGWGWLAAGVLALGLNGFYQDGGAAWAHRVADEVADRSGALVDVASGTVDQLTAKVELAAARGETTSCKLATAISTFSRAGMKLARRRDWHTFRRDDGSACRKRAWRGVEADRARIEAQVARVGLAPMAFDAARIPVVVCPRVRVGIPRVNVPKLPMVRIPAPVMDVHVVSAEPI